MKTYIICKADPLTNRSAPVEDTEIKITGKIPDNMDPDDCKVFHARQAASLVEALFNSLPQGTFDMLIIQMMSKKVSLYQGVTDS